MRSDAQLRVEWAPAGRTADQLVVDFAFWTGAKVPGGIDRRCLGAFQALDRVFKRWGYRPVVGWCWGYANRKITGGSGKSLHAYAIATDTNAPTNPYGNKLVTDRPRGMVEEILAIRTKGGHPVFGWGGNYRNVKDAMHDEIIASPAELALGIVGLDLPAPVPTVPNAPAWPNIYFRYTPGRPMMTGQNVRWIQEQLVRQKHDLSQEGGIDSTYGPGMAAEVKAYQKFRGLDDDGVVGKDTWTRLAA